MSDPKKRLERILDALADAATLFLASTAGKRLIASALALLAGGTIAIVADDDGPGPGPARTITTIKAPPGLPRVTFPTDVGTQQDMQQAVDQATGAVDGPTLHEDLRDESPPGAPDRAAEKVVDAAAKITRGPPVSGGAQNLSCPAQTVRNRSSRNGAKVVQVVLHYTVSGPFSGPAIVRFFDTPSAGASSHAVLQPDGWCRQIVPFSAKAWTQGAFNPVSDSVEITAMGSESRAWWLAQPIFAKGLLAEWVRDRLRARGLPIRRVDPVGCTPVAGWTDHDALECGNNHHDVKPNFPYDELARQLRAAPSSTDRVTCRKLNWWRAHGRPGGEPEANAVRRRRALEARGVVCTAAGPVLA